MSGATAWASLGTGSAVVAACAPWAARTWSVDRARRSLRSGRHPGAGPGPGARSGPLGGPPDWFDRSLAALALVPAPAWAWPAAVVGVGLLALWLVVTLPGLAVVAVVGRIGLGRWRARPAAARRFGSQELEGALEALRTVLASGGSLVTALDRASARPGAVGAELAVVRSWISAGSAEQAALDRWALDHGDGGVRVTVDALAIAGATGASRAAALAAARTTVAERRSLAAEIRSLAAPARASAAVLVVVPVAFAVAVAAVDAGVRRFLVGSPGGWGCLAGGLALDAVGAWWMAALVRRVR